MPHPCWNEFLFLLFRVMFMVYFFVEKQYIRTVFIFILVFCLHKILVIHFFVWVLLITSYHFTLEYLSRQSLKSMNRTAYMGSSSHTRLVNLFAFMKVLSRPLSVSVVPRAYRVCVVLLGMLWLWKLHIVYHFEMRLLHAIMFPPSPKAPCQKK